jgi:hypothetical protein
VAAMNNDQEAKVMTAIRELASAEGRPVTVRHVCQACARALHAGGVGLYLIGDLGVGEPIYVTDTVSDQITDLQVTVGEGPAVQALDELCPVLEPELTSGPSMHRWPVFAPMAVEAGALAMFAFPLVHGAISVGVLEIYRPTEGELSGDEVADALLFADAAMTVLVDQVGNIPAVDDAEVFTDGLGARWAEIHQAISTISVQLGSGLTEAFLRLRAHAYVTGMPLSEVAEEVLTRQMQFTPDDDNGRPRTSEYDDF